MAFASATTAQAQDVAVETPPSSDAAAPPVAAATQDGRQVYLPADFARYAPRNALDMLSQVPGFSIRASDEQRGLGQATGNVLFNGDRPSSKSDDIFAQLQRIPAADVQRVEILDGATLSIPGLSGQVANIVFEANGVSGQFVWNPEVRPYNADPNLYSGSVSVTGKSGALAYEFGLNNLDSGHGGADGLTFLSDPDGTVFERRDDNWKSTYHSPKLSGKLTWEGTGGSVAHLNGHYQRIYDRYNEIGQRETFGLPDQLRTVTQRSNTWNYEVGGDYEFGLGPGRLKAIALRRFSHEPFSVEVVSDFADDSASVGSRFTQTGDVGETIARGEYSWKMFGGDWQVAGEGAFNTLDNVAGLFVLDPDGEFVEVDFPGGTGGVKEDRYEGSISYGRSLTPKLSMQLLLAAEHSTIVTTGANGLERTFLRPKGQLALAWKPSSDFDVALKIQRRVLQLSFYDFLARAFLNDDNANASNNELRPQQDWSYEAELNRKWGAWGSSKLQFIYRDVEDKVDIIPVEGGEAVGNIPTSWAAAVISTNTLNLDPAGIRGMKLETTFVLQTSRLKDPFTAENRQWSGFTDRQAFFGLRHDIPDSDWAYGAEASHNRRQPTYRSNESDKVWEGPWFASVYVEHKDVFGLTVRGQVGNILDARSRRERVVYEGQRGASPVDFFESRDRRIGPIFSLSVRGNF